MRAPLSTSTGLSSLVGHGLKLGGDQAAASGTQLSLGSTRMSGAGPGRHAGERTEGQDNNTDGDEEQQPNRDRNEPRNQPFHHELGAWAASATCSTGERRGEA